MSLLPFSAFTLLASILLGYRAWLMWKAKP